MTHCAVAASFFGAVELAANSGAEAPRAFEDAP